VYLDEKFSSGGGFTGRTCRSCKTPIHQGQPATRVTFNTDPDGARGLTGDYHLACSKPFASLAHVINLNPWR
jgi:hypothetical protein